MSARALIEFNEHGEVAEYTLGPSISRVHGAVARDDDLELAALCGIAWEHRADPEALRARVAAIVDRHDRRHIRRYERRLRARAAVLQVLRETNPQPEGGRRRAA